MRKILLFSLLIVSCSKGIPRNKHSDQVIPRDEMISILTEMTKLEAHIQNTYVTIDKYYAAMNLTGDSLLKSHGYTFAIFDESMSYYGSRQDEMISIYSGVLDQLNQELGEIESKK